ncbi:MAG: aminotransferase class I/II-fold pyridoxal phosphate-dependent enzyme [Candidatus Aminicenantes bacterium]|nr:MAG: aminotransferase class I/II-fold pyridoxal phosphate-dependent enzyme [Candidatus Aminicenantes bacterium]
MKVTNLELSTDEMLRMGESALRSVIDHIARLPVSSCNGLDRYNQVMELLSEPPPEKGMDFEPVFDYLINQAIPASITHPHPAFMGYIPGGGLYASAIADFIAAATNRYVGVSFAAPVLAQLEKTVLDWFVEWMMYPDSARGILTSGGSLANFSAVVTARKHLLGENFSKGIVYMSSQTHHCVIKVANLAGIPEENFRMLDVDGNFRAFPEYFEAAIKEDLEKGLKPFLLVGNAGSINTGAVDPLIELGDVAKRYGLWYHIDAAYGGFFNLCEEGKKKLKGIECSDSVVLDPHKGLFIPYGTGSLLVRDGDLLRRAHVMSADYIQDHPVPDYMWDAADYSPELSRSFRGLRVWLPLKLFGVQAFRENLSEKLRLTRWIYQRFAEEPGFECLSPPELSAFAFRYRPEKGDIDAFNRKLLKTIVASKKLYLSSTQLNGEFVIRICILGFRTHKPDVERAFDLIVTTARNLENLE